MFFSNIVWSKKILYFFIYSSVKFSKIYLPEPKLCVRILLKTRTSNHNFIFEIWQKSSKNNWLALVFLSSNNIPKITNTSFLFYFLKEYFRLFLFIKKYMHFYILLDSAFKYILKAIYMTLKAIKNLLPPLSNSQTFFVFL